MFCIKSGAPILQKTTVSYDTEHFVVKREYRIWIFRGSGTMLPLLKAIFQLFSESVAAAARTKSFNDIVTPHMKKFSRPIKRKSNRGTFGTHLDYAVVELS